MLHFPETLGMTPPVLPRPLMSKRKDPDMPYDREFIPDETVFLMSGQKMLSDVLRALEDQLNGTPLRDARSAFRFLTERARV